MFENGIITPHEVNSFHNVGSTISSPENGAGRQKNSKWNNIINNKTGVAMGSQPGSRRSSNSHVGNPIGN